MKTSPDQDVFCGELRANSTFGHFRGSGVPFILLKAIVEIYASDQSLRIRPPLVHEIRPLFS
jgi:hypothetical protein